MIRLGKTRNKMELIMKLAKHSATMEKAFVDGQLGCYRDTYTTSSSIEVEWLDQIP